MASVAHPLADFADLFAAVPADEQGPLRAAIMDALAEGWAPTRADIELLVRDAREDLTDADFLVAVRAAVVREPDSMG